MGKEEVLAGDNDDPDPIVGLWWPEDRARAVESRIVHADIRMRTEWATEAAMDPDVYVERDRGARHLFIVVGRSPSAPPEDIGDSGRMLEVWLVKEREWGRWRGQDAFDAHPEMVSKYEAAFEHRRPE